MTTTRYVENNENIHKRFVTAISPLNYQGRAVTFLDIHNKCYSISKRKDFILTPLTWVTC